MSRRNNEVTIRNPTKGKSIQQIGIILMIISPFVIFSNCTRNAEMTVFGFIMGIVGFVLKLIGKARHEYYWKDGL